jgi:hydroxypyruvate reductase
MHRTNEQLRKDAIAIWQAGVDAVDSCRLVRENVSVQDNELNIVDHPIQLDRVRRIVVVGAGKAGAGMAAGMEAALGPQLLAEKDVTGWLNVPADCVRELQRIHLHAARPAGVNEPTQAGVDGALRILEMVGSLGPHDLCLCLISGGGSALLPAPIEGITLADKQALTKFLSGAGANIEDLNTVRKQLSSIKGGGLARACGAGQLITLIISDVIGDPLDVIASGPTVPNTSTARDALAVLERFSARQAGISSRVFECLERLASATQSASSTQGKVANVVIGNNAVAVDAAGMEAERRGYAHAMVAASQLEGAAEEVGVHQAQMAHNMRGNEGPDCLITGGEPVVHLVDAAERGLGGRNQQLVLAALLELMKQADDTSNPLEGMVLLSGGTDGEDGPTDAAGAVIDAPLFEAMRRVGHDPATFLSRNDAYRFFQPLNGLLKTGPTHTNVCDVRVTVVSRE